MNKNQIPITRKKHISKKILGIIGLFFLTAISPALWESIFKPCLKYLYSNIIELIVKISSTYEAKLYSDISKGLHEMPSLSIYLFFLLFLAGSVFVLTLSVLIITSRKVKSHESKFKQISRKKWIGIFLMIYIMVYAGLEVFSETYINTKITYFEQSSNIIAPYISHEEQLLIKSEFAQINDKEDYDRLVIKIHDIATKNNISIKKYSFSY